MIITKTCDRDLTITEFKNLQKLLSITNNTPIVEVAKQLKNGEYIKRLTEIKDKREKQKVVTPLKDFLSLEEYELIRKLDPKAEEYSELNTTELSDQIKLYTNLSVKCEKLAQEDIDKNKK